MINLYDFQKEVKQEINQLFKRGIKKVIMQMPTGAGKTRTFCSIISDRFNEEDNFRCIVVAHRDELLNQIGETLATYGIEYGMIKAQKERDFTYQVQVASIGTLRNEKSLDGKVDLIVIDEAHHTGADSYNDLFSRFNNADFIGATATPCRMDGDVLKNYYDEIVIGPDISTLIDKKKLSPIKILKPQDKLEGIDNLRIQYNDYDTSELGDFMSQPEIRSEIVNSYLNHCYGKKGIVYAVNRNHALAIYSEYLSYNIPATYIISGDSSNNPEERKKSIEDFNSGKYKILINVNIFTEGFDSPDVDFVQLARPTKSLILYLQQVGRALRKTSRKRYATILDNAGLTIEHGSFVSYKYDWKFIFENGLEDANTYMSYDNDKLNRAPVESDVTTIEEGDDELVAEVYGIEDDIEIVHFFSQQLKELYDHIRSLSIISKGYESEQSVYAVKELEGGLYDIASQNKNFYEETEKWLDDLDLEINALNFEYKHIKNIIKEAEVLESDQSVKETLEALLLLYQKGVKLSEEQFDNIQKTVDLDKETIKQYISGEFNYTDLSKELESILDNKRKLNDQKNQINEQLEKIKELAWEGKIAKNYINEEYKEKTKESEKVFKQKEFPSTSNNKPDFESYNREKINLIIQDPEVGSSNIIRGAFEKVLSANENHLTAELEKLYNDPLDYYKKPGMGPHKAKTIRWLIEKGNMIENVELYIHKYNQNNDSKIKYINDLKAIEDILKTDLNEVEYNLIKYNSKHKILDVNEKEKTLIEIAHETNTKLGTVKVQATRMRKKIEKIIRQLANYFNQQTINNINSRLKSSHYDPMKIFYNEDLISLNKEYDVKFTKKVYGLILKELYNDNIHIVDHKNLSNIYLTNTDADSIKTFIEKHSQIFENPTNYNIPIENLNEDEKRQIYTIIKLELEPYILEYDDNTLTIQFLNQLSNMDKLILVCRELGKPSTSNEIFKKSEEMFPGTFNSTNQISADYLCRDNFESNDPPRMRNRKYFVNDG